MVRRAAGRGVLVAMPAALVSAGSLPLDPSEMEVVGPHVQFEVPAVRLSEFGMDSLGIDISVHMDLGVDALRAMTPLSLLPESGDPGPHWFWRGFGRCPAKRLASCSGLSENGLLFCRRGEEHGERQAAPLPPREPYRRCHSRSFASQAEGKGVCKEACDHGCSFGTADRPDGASLHYDRADLRVATRS